MIISDRFVFLHLQKCATTFVSTLLEEMFSDARRKRPDHNSFTDIKPRDLGKTIFGTVRNPWDWYVSYYFYKKPKGERGLARKTFIEQEPALGALLYPKFSLYAGGTFDYWLGELFRAGLNGAVFRGSGRHGVVVIDTALMNTLGIGPYTYWFVHCYFEDPETVLQNWNVDRILSGDLGSLGCKNYCRVEDLRNELLRFFASIDLELTSEQHSLLMSYPIKNNSNPGNRVTETFYNEEKSALIREKEELIVRMFGYEEPWNA